MKPPMKDTPKEDKPFNKGQAESTLVYILYRKSPLKGDNLQGRSQGGGGGVSGLKKGPLECMKRSTRKYEKVH